MLYFLVFDVKVCFYFCMYKIRIMKRVNFYIFLFNEKFLVLYIFFFIYLKKSLVYMFIIKMFVNCMLKDNYKLLFFKIVGLYIRKIWKYSFGIYCLDKIMIKSLFRGEWERRFCIVLLVVIFFKILIEILVKIGGRIVFFLLVIWNIFIFG